MDRGESAESARGVARREKGALANLDELVLKLARAQQPVQVGPEQLGDEVARRYVGSRQGNSQRRVDEGGQGDEARKGRAPLARSTDERTGLQGAR